jgi:hypothetical protein
MGVHEEATRWTPAQAARRALNQGLLPTDQEWTWVGGASPCERRLALEDAHAAEAMLRRQGTPPGANGNA